MTNTTNTDQADPVEGGSYDTWGDILDANRQIVDKALGSTAVLNVTDAGYSISQDESNHAILKIVGTVTADVVVQSIAGKSRFWQVLNATTGGFDVVMQVAGSMGQQINVRNTKWAYVNSDGTDCRVINADTFDGRQITISEAQPTGGRDGDIHFRVLP